LMIVIIIIRGLHLKGEEAILLELFLPISKLIYFTCIGVGIIIWYAFKRDDYDLFN
jgi:hypothetical protein